MECAGLTANGLLENSLSIRLLISIPHILPGPIRLLLKPRNNDLPRPIVIVYHRLPNNIREYPGILREESANMLTIESRLTTSKPTIAFGKIVADTGYSAIWFIFKNRWYDVGKFYDLSGKWLGYYCDIIQPVPKLLADKSRTVNLTDLYLDIWISPENKFLILDENELAIAVEKKHITHKMAERIKYQMNILIQTIRKGEFPSNRVKKTGLMQKST